MEKTRPVRRPLGITILAFFFILIAFNVVNEHILKSNPIFFGGKMHTGKTAYVIAGIYGVINLFLGVGLLRLKKYAWWVLIVFNCYTFFSLIINIIVQRFFTTQINNLKYRTFFEYFSSPLLSFLRFMFTKKEVTLNKHPWAEAQPKG